MSDHGPDENATQPLNVYDPLERQREKQRSRDQDDRDLREGSVSREEMQRRNSFFSSVDLANSSIRLRRKSRNDKSELSE